MGDKIKETHVAQRELMTKPLRNAEKKNKSRRWVAFSLEKERTSTIE